MIDLNVKWKDTGSIAARIYGRYSSKVCSLVPVCTVHHTSNC